MIADRFETEVGIVHIRSTERSDGSFAIHEPEPALRARQRRILGATARTWVGLRQVHGVAVHRVSGNPGDRETPIGRLPEADAAVSFDPVHAPAVLTADCAPVVLIGSTGVAAVHAGWRGATDGIIDRAADELRANGAAAVATFLGPCIQPEQYEFGERELEDVVTAFGADVVGRTSTGRPALDLTRVVQLACERAGWPIPTRPRCTSEPGFFSHRTRKDSGRHATVAWIEPDAS